MKSTEAREAAVRRMWTAVTDGAGYLQKTPARHWTREYYGAGYMLIKNGFVVLGCGNREYEASLEEVEEFIRDIQMKQLQSAATA